MSKKLVAYFSASGVTAKLAKILQKQQGQTFMRYVLKRLTQTQTSTGRIRTAEAR